MVVGDFNGDGVPDLATANYNGNNVTVLLGNGAGGFTPAMGSPFPSGTSPTSLVVGDFNGDGVQDLATANYGSNNVTVLLGGKAATSSALGTTSPLTITLGQPVPLTLTVSDTTTAFNAPTGTATFSDGATVLGTASQTGSPFTFSAANLSVGSHTLSATYGGDTRSLGSTSNSITIQVLSCDLQQNGTIGVPDVQLIINEALGVIPAVHDLSGDGTVNVTDIQIVTNAVLNLGCVVK